MDCVFWGENEKSFFKLDDMEKNRVLLRPFYPTDNIDFLMNKKKPKNKKSTKQDGEIRILGIDVALMGELTAPSYSNAWMKIPEKTGKLNWKIS